MELTLICVDKSVLTVTESSIIRKGKDSEKIIPLSKVQSFSFTAATLYNGGGSLEIKTAEASEGMIHWGWGFSSSLGTSHVYRYKYKELQNAIKIRDYISDYLNKQRQAVPSHNPEESEKRVVSVVDEIRGLKALMDEGILTQEEFESKKKQLLGI